MNSRRQFEINEWYNYDKLETLFFLQIVFMASLSVAIVMFWTKKGLITVGLAGILYGILGLLVAGVGLYKYYYTAGARDVKLWHRRRFNSTPGAPPATPVCDNGLPFQKQIDDAMSLAMDGAITAGKCANTLNQGLDNINAAATAEMIGVQSGKLDLLQQVNSTGGALLNAVCGQ